MKMQLSLLFGLTLTLAACSSKDPQSIAETSVPRGLSAATVVFDERHVTVCIPMDAITWGSSVELDESAGFASQLEREKAFAERRPLNGAKEPEFGAFGLIMKLAELESQTINFVIWPQELLDSEKYLLLECFDEPQHSLYGQPRSWRARLLQDQIRRARLGNVAIGTAADQETILIHDSSILFEDFIKHRPQRIEVYVSLKGKGIQRSSVTVDYRVDVSKAKLAPTLH